MSRWVFGLDLQREVDQRWRPGTRLPKVRAQGCSHAERSNLRNVKEFSQTKGEVRATEGSRLVHFSFSGQSEWTSFSVQEFRCHTRVPPGWSSVVPVLAALLCPLCFHSDFSTLVISGVLRCLLTFLGPSSVCERDVQKEPQQVSQSGAKGPLSHVTGQYHCGILTA